MSNFNAPYAFDISSKSFAEKAFDPVNGEAFLKEASQAASLFVQDQEREDGFGRNVVETVQVSPSELVEVDFTDQPALIVYNDVDTRAMTVPLRGRGNFRYYETKKFYVFFDKIVSEKIRKSKIEMMATRIDYKELFKKRIAEAMYKVEDMTVIAGANKVLTEEWGATSAANKLVDTDNYTKSGQTIKFKDGVTLDKDSLVEFFKMPMSNKNKINNVLLTQTLLQDIIKMSMLEVGDANVSDFWNKGVENIKSFWGKKIVTTIKNEVVPENKIYGFAGGKLYGWLFILRDHTVYMETDREMLTIDADSYMSHAIGNTKGVYQAEFSV
jgi:hypothetical protein